MKTTDKDDKTFIHEMEITEKIYNGEDNLLPIKYILMLTNDCNLKCPFCFMEQIVPEDAMTTENWFNVINQLPDYARIILMGGEPLLFKGFKEVYEKATQNHRVTIPTNGLLLSKEMIDYLLSKENLVSIKISIDDIGNKGRKFTAGQWETLCNNIKYLTKRRDELKLNLKVDSQTLLLDSNVSEIFELHKFFHEELNVNYNNYFLLHGSPLQMSDRLTDFDCLNLPVDVPLYDKWTEIVEQLEKIRDYNKKNGKLSYFQPKVFDMNLPESIDDINQLNEPEFNKEFFIPCMTPWSDLRIYGDGNVSCCLSVNLGNVKKETIKEIVTGKRMKQFRHLLKTDFSKHCQRCNYLYAKKYALPKD